MIDGLLLQTKGDIPFISAELTIHQPSCKEIGMIGEEAFFTAAQFLTLDKSSIPELSAEDAAKINNIDIILKTVNDAAPAARFNKTCAESLLALMFPEYKVMFLPRMIAFVKDGENHLLNDKNFEEFQQVIKEMYCLHLLNGQQQREYDAANKHAQMIVDKIKKGRQKLAAQKNSQSNGQKISILSRYISILSVGEQKDKNILSEYSVYQLFDEFNRYSLKEQSDFYLQAKMAGAKDLQEVDNWMKDLYSTSNT